MVDLDRDRIYYPRFCEFHVLVTFRMKFIVELNSRIGKFKEDIKKWNFIE